MSLKSNLAKAVAVGAVLATASSGVASAAVSNHGSPVYRSPSYNSRVVNFLTRGEHVRLIDRRGSWCDISIPGPNGWVKCYVLGNFPLERFRPGITFNFGFGFPGMGGPHFGWWWNNNSHSWWNNDKDSHDKDPNHKH
jgi:hypothetical protein